MSCHTRCPLPQCVKRFRECLSLYTQGGGLWAPFPSAARMRGDPPLDVFASWEDKKVVDPLPTLFHVQDVVERPHLERFVVTAPPPPDMRKRLAPLATRRVASRRSRFCGAVHSPVVTQRLQMRVSLLHWARADKDSMPAMFARWCHGKSPFAVQELAAQALEEANRLREELQEDSPLGAKMEAFAEQLRTW